MTMSRVSWLDRDGMIGKMEIDIDCAVGVSVLDSTR